MMLLDTYVIILMKSIVSGPFKRAGIFIPHALITNNQIYLIKDNIVFASAEPEASWV